MAKTLFEYYTAKGQKLPSVAERAPLAAQYGISNYKGTAEQNNLLLSKLEATAPIPVPGGTSNPLPSGATSAIPNGGGQAIQPSAGTETAGDLGNLRIALREALNEAAKSRVEKNFNIAAPLSGGVPGTLGSIVDMIRGGIKAPVETTFSDIISGYKDATDAKKKEIDRINELRAEYGSVVPSSVQDLSTALDLIAPTVDKERRLALEKMAKDQAADNDIESWADSFARGEVSIGNVPAAIRTAVKVRADKIKATLETEAKSEYKSRIAFRLEKKQSDFDQERGLTMQDDNLTVVEQREVIDYIDSLEAAQKAAKKTSGKGFFNFLSPSKNEDTSTSNASSTGGKAPSLFGPTNPNTPTNYTPSLKPFDDAFVAPFRNLLKQK